jgi:hypothetical protein
MALVAIVFGPPGCGKTVDLGYSFPTAHFIGMALTPGGTPEGLESISTTCGYSDFTYHHAGDMLSARKVVAKLPKGSIIVFDDFSSLARESVRIAKKKHRNGYDIWDEVIFAAIDLISDLGPHMLGVLNCWGQGAKKNDDGSMRPRGPKLVGQLVEEVPGRAHLVVEATYEPMRKPWPWAYSVNPDPRDITKDRFNVVARISPAPMNFAEILRANGVALPYKYEWQEALTQQLSEQFAEAASPRILANDYYRQLTAGSLTPAQARWVLRDALDRVVIQRALTVSNTDFIT